ncbi:hypothetical protein C8Q79DRAFT_1012437 [Trametes meyenii]|nr:hypothetical protein C8Q79DRAFT_1012437 [Trametes meyenii]
MSVWSENDNKLQLIEQLNNQELGVKTEQIDLQSGSDEEALSVICWGLVGADTNAAAPLMKEYLVPRPRTFKLINFPEIVHHCFGKDEFEEDVDHYERWNTSQEWWSLNGVNDTVLIAPEYPKILLRHPDIRQAPGAGQLIGELEVATMLQRTVGKFHVKGYFDRESVQEGASEEIQVLSRSSRKRKAVPASAQPSSSRRRRGNSTSGEETLPPPEMKRADGKFVIDLTGEKDTKGTK